MPAVICLQTWNCILRYLSTPTVVLSAQGLIYLQDSPLHFHGNLKASNCLVDSRWVVKLSDFGLSEFKSGEETHHHYMQHNFFTPQDEVFSCKCEGQSHVLSTESCRLLTTNMFGYYIMNNLFNKSAPYFWEIYAHKFISH